MNQADQKSNVNLTDWRDGGSFIRLQELNLFVRHVHNHDDAQTLLLIHGFPTASWDWHRLWLPLSARFNLVAMDMPGFGLSAKPGDLDYSISLQADLQIALLDHLNISHCHLLVHDYGVSVAQELLARQNADTNSSPRFASCVFLNGGLFHGVHKPLLIQKLLASPIGFMLSPLIGKSAVRRSMQRIFANGSQPDTHDIEQMWALIRHNHGQRISHKLIRYMHERKRFYQRWLDALRASDIPLRLIVGADDPISGAHLAEAYRELIQAADVVELADTGHYPQLENPMGVLKHALAFWRGQGVV